MSDFTLCSGEGCPLAEKCFRTSHWPNSQHQSIMKPPYKNGCCDLFISKNGKEKNIYSSKLKSKTKKKKNGMDNRRLSDSHLSPLRRLPECKTNEKRIPPMDNNEHLPS